MQVRTGVGVLFAAQFTESKVGKTGLTVTVNVYLVNTSGSASTVVTGGSATEVGKGVYSYLLASGSNATAGVLIAVFITATTSVDQQEIPAAWGIELPAPCAIKSIDNNAITAASIADGAITASEAPALADIGAIRAKTDTLPSDPADASDIAGSFGSIATTLTSITSSLTTIAGYLDTEVAAIKAKTDALPASPAAVSDVPTAAANASAVWSAATRSLTDKDGFNLSATGLDQIAATEPNGVATTFREKLMQVWARFFRKADRTSTQVRVYRADEITVATTQTWTDSGGTETVGGAT